MGRGLGTLLRGVGPALPWVSLLVLWTVTSPVGPVEMAGYGWLAVLKACANARRRAIHDAWIFVVVEVSTGDTRKGLARGVMPLFPAAISAAPKFSRVISFRSDARSARRGLGSRVSLFRKSSRGGDLPVGNGPEIRVACGMPA